MDDISQITMIEMYGEGRATLRDVCERFKIHRTTVWRQLKALRQFGRDGLVHKLKGRPSNRSKPVSIRSAVLELFRQIGRDQPLNLLQFYQKSIQGTGLNVSYTTVRRWLKASGKTD
jgi:transposase